MQKTPIARHLAIAIALALASTASLAETPDEAIAARKQALKHIKQTLNDILKPMMSGAKPFDKTIFEQQAMELAQQAKQPWPHFIAGSDKGKTEAKAEVWSKPADFKAAADKLEASTQALADTAKSGDPALIKPAFAAVGQSCKACHDNFKRD